MSDKQMFSVTLRATTFPEIVIEVSATSMVEALQKAKDIAKQEHQGFEGQVVYFASIDIVS